MRYLDKLILSHSILQSISFCLKTILVVICIGFYAVNLSAIPSDVAQLEILIEKENPDSEDLAQMIEIISDLIQNKYENVGQYLESVLKIAEDYAALGNFEQALIYHYAYQELMSEKFSKKKKRAIAEMHTEYEMNLKNQELEHSRQLADEQRAQFVYLNLSLVLFVIGAFILIVFLYHRNRTMKVLYYKNKEIKHSFYENKHQEKNTEVIQDPLFKLFNSITELFDKNEIYTDPDVSLKKLADMLSSNEKYVSMAISTYSDKNFNHFLNMYRINKARGILDIADNSHRINEVMYDCGYNSSSTFYRSFKKFTGMTPKQYVAMAERDRKKSNEED